MNEQQIIATIMTICELLGHRVSALDVELKYQDYLRQVRDSHQPQDDEYGG